MCTNAMSFDFVTFGFVTFGFTTFGFVTNNKKASRFRKASVLRCPKITFGTWHICF